MLEFSDYIILFLLGSIGAFVAGFLGVGGGVIYIPILDYFLSKLGLTDQLLVQAILANSLFVIIFSGSVASYKHYKINNFFPKEVLYTSIPGIVSVLVTTYFIKLGSWYSKELFNYVFATLMLTIIVRMFFSGNQKEVQNPQPVKPLYYSITGFFAGFITALSGLGGGIIMTPVFTDMLNIPIKKASSISNGVIPFLAIAVGLYNVAVVAPVIIPNWQIGFIVLPIVLPMIAATFILAPIGVKVSHSTNPIHIRFIFISFVGIIFIKLLYEIFN